jgi:hypothetical protein
MEPLEKVRHIFNGCAVYFLSVYVGFPKGFESRLRRDSEGDLGFKCGRELGHR